MTNDAKRGVCRYCDTRTWNVRHWHQADCPTITNVWPAPDDLICIACDEPMDVYTHVSAGNGVVLPVCLGCAALEAAGA